jgi:hypothetical protein
MAIRIYLTVDTHTQQLHHHPFRILAEDAKASTKFDCFFDLRLIQLWLAHA